MFIFNELSDCLENNHKKVYLPCRELPLYSEKLSIKTKIRISTLYTGKNITQSTPPLLPYAVLFFVTILRRKKKKAEARSAAKLWCHSQQPVWRSKRSSTPVKERRKWGWAQILLLSTHTLCKHLSCWQHLGKRGLEGDLSTLQLLKGGWSEVGGDFFSQVPGREEVDSNCARAGLGWVKAQSSTVKGCPGSRVDGSAQMESPSLETGWQWGTWFCVGLSVLC